MSRVSVLLLDAFGTIIELEPPAPSLVRGLCEQYGIEISPDGAARVAAGRSAGHHHARRLLRQRLRR